MAPVGSASQGTAPVPPDGEAAPAQGTAPAGTSAIPTPTEGGDKAKVAIETRAAQDKIDQGTKQVQTGETEKTAGMAAMSLGVAVVGYWPVGTIIGLCAIVGGAVAYGVGTDQSNKGHKKVADGQSGMAGADAAAGTIGKGATAAIDASAEANKKTPADPAKPDGPQAAADAAKTNTAGINTKSAPTAAPTQPTTTAPATPPPAAAPVK